MKVLKSSAFLALCLVTVLASCTHKPESVAPSTPSGTVVTPGAAMPPSTEGDTTSATPAVPATPGTGTGASTGSGESTTPATPATPATGSGNTGATLSGSVTVPTAIPNVKQYNYTETYMTPAGEEKAMFTFTVAEGRILAVQVATESKNEITQKLVGMFTSGVPEKVVGLDVATLGTFDKVGGSSLTPIAFNKAVTKLKAEVN